MFWSNILASNNKKQKWKLKETKMLSWVALTHQPGILWCRANSSLNTKKDLPMVKEVTVTIDHLFQTELAIKMIELKEENKEEELLRVMIWIVQLVPSQTMQLPSNLKDKLVQTLWNKKETLVIRINNILERQKEVLKVQVWEEAETKLRTKTQM